MGKASSRAAQREQKLEALLDHASELLVEGGFEHLTMPRLAARAGVAVGGLYRYFEGKQALYIALQVRALEHLHAYLTARVHDDPVEHVRAYVLGMADYLADHPVRFNLLDVAISDPTIRLPDDQAEVTIVAVRPLFEELDARLARCTAAGRLTDGNVRDRTLALWGTVFGTLHSRKFARFDLGGAHSRALLELAVTALLRGWERPG